MEQSVVANNRLHYATQLALGRKLTLKEVEGSS